MSANVQSKRSYTAPIIFVVLVVLMTLIIVVSTKYLFMKQTHTTDQGKQLAEEYNYALIYADRLHNGTDLMLSAKSEADRMRAARMLGEAHLASGESLGLFLEAQRLTTGQSTEETGNPIIVAMNTVFGEKSILASVGEHEGTLTEQEIAMLTLVRDGAAQMQQALNRFRPPSGEAGFRQMVTVADWVPNVVEASKYLEQLADNL
ncbi:hypothetical protein [Cohnella mopanensis]|uniref:hypothetical protein n=1 Tax=Cohnella mopanensis TaxID=2911966 RepID=UPI001EF8FA9E|nr:hypothetical protein [Cohnella mopanensis]